MRWLFFAAGQPQGKNGPSGQQAEGAAWGHFLFRMTLVPQFALSIYIRTDIIVNQKRKLLSRSG